MTKINTIYLDMDGVICDFRGACEERKCIEGTKVDWSVVKAEGATFWENLKWLPGGQDFYKWLEKICNEENIELCILSAVTYPEGKVGKINWLLKNTNIDRHHIFLVDYGKDKRYYVSEDALLIDDYHKNCAIFSEPKTDGSLGGQAVLYTNPGVAKAKVMNILGLQ